MDIPIQDGTSFTNAIQQRGVSTTYGKRYSFINSLGVIIEDEDTDGSLSFEDGIEFADEWMAFKACNSEDDLRAAWDEMKKKYLSDRGKMLIIAGMKNKRKAELSKENNNE